jgi:diguanylate cyclase (GGDEF)-like protein/PAS domain S-box-containing protein
MPSTPGPRAHALGSDAEALAAAVVAGASDAIMAMDRDGALVLWNAGCEALFGWTAEQVRGRSIEMLLPPGRQDEIRRVVRALAGHPEPAALETERLHRNGQVLPVSCRLSPLVDATGEVIGACAVVRDSSREMQLRQQVEQARHLAEARFEQSVVAQATLSPEGVLVEVNPALCRLSGYDAKQLLGRTVTDFMSEPERDAAADRLAHLASGDLTGWHYPQLLRHATGRYVETQVSIFPLRDDDSGKVLRLEAVVEDVSAAAAAERELQLREARWQAMAMHSADVALFCDVRARLLFVSSSVASVLGYTPEQLLGSDGSSLVHPDDAARVREAWLAVAAAPGGTSETVEMRLRHADGSWHWVEESVTNHLEDPAVAAMVVNLVDVSQRKAAEAVLAELAGRDPLTGLATRAPLMAALDAAFAADRGSSTALAVVDVAQMKLVNDTHGHLVGDEVLCQLAARLRAAAPSQSVVARVGGDRMAILLHDAEDIGDVFERSAALLDAVQVPLRLHGRTVTLSATLGAALGPAVEGGALLASAESALLTAKEGLTGPMHVVRAESASAAVFHARLVEDLRRGLQQDELVVHFQPVICLADGQPVAAEALVRWAHPTKGLLSPAAFIAAAEDSGLIIEVGHKVLQEACRAAARWAKISGRSRPFHVAVNLSARQLTGGGVVDVVRTALEAEGVAPANLMLEVTESAVMSDVDEAVRTLQQLRELGVAIAVDDFGTGYSSLTYLKRFPVTTLKIDRSFVSGLGSDDDDAAIVTSVINLARAMHLGCIAEGVETEQQRVVLQSLGCAYGQGYLWSPALDIAAFEDWLNRGAAAAPASPGAHSAAPAPPGRHRRAPGSSPARRGLRR